MIRKLKLYAMLLDQLQKHTTIFWQFPVALVAADFTSFYDSPGYCLEALTRVHNRALNLSVGIESTLMNAQNTRTTLKTYLLKTMEALDGEAASLITALAEAKEVYGGASKD